MRQLLFTDLTRRVLSTSASGDTFSFPALTAGDSLAISLRFIQRIGSSTPREVYPKIRAVRASIGFIDQRPVHGSFSLKIGDAAISAGNTTALLPHNATAAQIKASLTPLVGPDIAATFEDGSYIIHCDDGRKLDLTVVRNTLFPTSFGRIFAYEVNAEWLHELRLVQAPLAHTDSSERVLPLAPSVTTIQDGYTSYDGLFTFPEIQQLTIPPDFRGSYQLKLDDYYRTDILDTSDGPSEIQSALNAMLAKIGPMRSVTVTNPSAGQALITFDGKYYEGTDVDQLVPVVASAPPGDPTVELDLGTAEIWTALRGSPELAGVPLELEIDVLDDTATGDDDINASFRTVKVQSSVRLKRAVFFPGLSALQNVDWLRNPSPKDYVPFTPSQVITGTQHYVSVFGDGTSTQYRFPHNLGTAALHVTVRENGGTNLVVSPDGYAAELASDNELVLKFPEPVEDDAMAVTISTAGPVTVQNIHTHTMGQIDGLDLLLEDIGRRLAALELLMPMAGVAGATSGESNVSFELPDIGEILADAAALDASETLASQIVVTNNNKPTLPSGTPVAAQEAKIAEEEKKTEADPDALPANVLYRVTIPGIGKTASSGRPAVTAQDGTVTVPAVPSEDSEPAVWPVRTNTAPGKWPLLLPAVEDSGISEVSSLPVMAAGTVWKSTAGIVLPGGSGRRSQTVPPNGYFASDGRAFYRVKREGSTDVFHPLEMERELWRVLLGDEQFPDGAALSVAGEIRTRMLGEFFDDDARNLARVDLGGQYMLKCEAVPVEGTVSLGAASAAVLLGQTRVALSPSLETFRWELSIRRETAGMVSSWLAYRKAQTGGNFALPAVIRLRLTAFDVDDASADPRGQVALIMPGTKLEISL